VAEFVTLLNRAYLLVMARLSYGRSMAAVVSRSGPSSLQLPH
jgi:hypothetical protein